MCCEFLQSGRCLVAERLARKATGQEVTCPMGADSCGRCEQEDRPRDLNRVTASLAVAGAQQIGQAGTVAAQYREVLRVGPAPKDVATCPPDGPGTELTKLLAMVGITHEPGCSCEQTECEMNRNGTAWCEQNIELIVGRMKHEARRRGLPFFKPAARRIVRLAIARASR